MGDVLGFWTAALAVAAAGFPIGAAALRRLPDAGAGLSFALGLTLTSVIYFLFRVLTILPPGRGGVVIALALVVLVAAAVAGRDRWLWVTWHRAWPGAIVAVGVFTLAFFSYTAFRSYNSEIGGTEQPMDFLFLNAAIASPEYPPRDPWLAGERVSYYYFGYVQAGVLTSIAGVPASTGYNLSLAYTFAAAATGIASLGFAFARWILGSQRRTWAMAAGGLAVGFLLLVGSLSAVFEWAAAHGNANRGIYEAFGVEWMLPCEAGQTEDCYSGPANPRTTEWYPTEYWFWWEGTRIIPGTITEFPFFSFMLGDLHPHVMALPLTLLAIGFAAATWRGRSLLDWRRLRSDPFTGLLVAAVFGALAFQNAWDVITFSSLLLLAVVARNFRVARPMPAVVAAATYLAPVGIAAIILYSPWWVTFNSQAGGLYAYVGEGTSPAHAFLQWGPILFAGLLAALYVRRSVPNGLLVNSVVAAAWAPVLPFIGWLALAQVRGTLSDGIDARTAAGWVTLVLLGTAVWLLASSAVVLAMRRHAAAPAAALVATGALLLYGAELFFIRDVFFNGIPRLNTVFKLSYQAWLLLSLGGGVALAAALAHRRIAIRAAALPVLVLAVLGLVYPLLASFNRTNGFDNPTAVDGLAAVARSDPNEYALVRWIAQNTAPDDVVIEATGRRWTRDSQSMVTMIDGGSDYGSGGRIASRTGRPTPIGWYSHEIQWRGDTPENHAEFGRRQDAVDRAYTATNPADVLDIMREFDARYIVVGREETGNYPGLMPDFEQFLEVAFESGTYRIYTLPELRSVPTS